MTTNKEQKKELLSLKPIDIADNVTAVRNRAAFTSD